MTILLTETFTSWRQERPSVSHQPITQIDTGVSWGFPPPGDALDIFLPDIPGVQDPQFFGFEPPAASLDDFTGGFDAIPSVRSSPQPSVPGVQETFQEAPAVWYLEGIRTDTVPPEPVIETLIVRPDGTVFLTWEDSGDDAEYILLLDDGNTTVEVGRTVDEFFSLEKLAEGAYNVIIIATLPLAGTSQVFRSFTVPPLPTVGLIVDGSGYLGSLSIGPALAGQTSIPITRDDDKFKVVFNHAGFGNYYQGGTNPWTSFLRMSFDGGSTFEEYVAVPDAGTFFYPVKDGVQGLSRIVVELSKDPAYPVRTEKIWVDVQAGIVSV